MHELWELFTQSKLGDTDSTGDVEEYERASGALFAVLAMLFWLLMVKAWFE